MISSSMYFVPTNVDIKASKSSTCGLATPKDSRDCEQYKVCIHRELDTGRCASYRIIKENNHDCY